MKNLLHTYFQRKNPTNKKSVKKFRVIVGVRCMSQIMFVMKWGRKNANWIIVPFPSCGVISDHCAVCMVQLWTLASLNPDFSKVLNIPMLPQPLAEYNLSGFKQYFFHDVFDIFIANKLQKHSKSDWMFEQLFWTEKCVSRPFFDRFISCSRDSAPIL